MPNPKRTQNTFIPMVTRKCHVFPGHRSRFPAPAMPACQLFPLGPLPPLQAKHPSTTHWRVLDGPTPDFSSAAVLASELRNKTELTWNRVKKGGTVSKSPRLLLNNASPTRLNLPKVNTVCIDRQNYCGQKPFSLH